MFIINSLLLFIYKKINKKINKKIKLNLKILLINIL